MNLLAEGEPQTTAAEKSLLPLLARTVAEGGRGGEGVSEEGVRRLLGLCRTFEARSGDAREAGFAAELRGIEARLSRIQGARRQVILLLPPTHFPPWLIGDGLIHSQDCTLPAMNVCHVFCMSEG